MLDIKFIVENLEHCKERLSCRNGDFSAALDAAVAFDKRRKEIINEVERLKAKKNAASAKVAIAKRNGEDISGLTEEIKEETDGIAALDAELSQVVSQLRDVLLSIPNLPDKSLPVGKSDENNVVVRKFSEPTKFDFEPKAHWDIGTNLGILDFAAAAKISGARFTVYRALGAKLERSIYNFMLDTHTQNGYTEIFPPYLVNRDSMVGTGQLPKFEEDMFAVKNTNYYLIPTAEVPVTNLLRDEIVPESELPIYYTAYTACFRGEAGSAGRDTRGLIRQHQFNKVELVKFVKPEDSYNELEKLTGDAERILQLLKLPYRVSLLCTGDIGFSSAKTYDLEVFMPSYNRYVEISSCSNFEDYQARRANIKYRNADKKTAFLHTLNGSGLAVGRTVAAILENYQNADGSVTVPEVLRKYMGVDVIR